MAGLEVPVADQSKVGHDEYVNKFGRVDFVEQYAYFFIKQS